MNTKDKRIAVIFGIPTVVLLCIFAVALQLGIKNTSVYLIMSLCFSILFSAVLAQAAALETYRERHRLLFNTTRLLVSVGVFAGLLFWLVGLPATDSAILLGVFAFVSAIIGELEHINESETRSTATK